MDRDTVDRKRWGECVSSHMFVWMAGVEGGTEASKHFDLIPCSYHEQ